MRPLTIEEIELVAGGTGTTIYVTGTRGGGGTWYPTTISIGGGGGGGGTNSTTDPHQMTEQAKDTPCVHYVPDGVDLHTLNNEVKYLADQCAAKSAADGNEWAGFVYKMPDGQLYETDPVSAGHPDDVNGIHVSLPQGALIVGYVHTHPDVSGIDERELSPDDQYFINNTLIGGGHADPNMLAYINTPSETGTPTTYVYDKTHRSSTSAGCSL